MSSTDFDTQGERTQEQKGQPKWLSEIRRKARLVDTAIPKLQRDLAVQKAKLDTSSATYDLWLRDYEQRQRERDDFEAAGEWYVAAMREDAARFGLLQPELPDHSEEAAAQRRMQAVAEGAVDPDSKAGLHGRMSKARSPEELAAIYAASGGAVIRD